ncbi:titin [Anopheles bellator]|uniref:titin n=1 Tax=Anopheles bellator TaxID=139047 RepID=UPI002647F688|nr:titin [Anopheles bellator]
MVAIISAGRSGTGVVVVNKVSSLVTTKSLKSDVGAIKMLTLGGAGSTAVIKDYQSGRAAHGAVYSPGGGGVYGDSSSPRDAGGDPVFAVVPSQDVNPDYYITQTVYGFLDFTTTIGNTVMIFSPQSAAPAVTEPPKTTAPPPPVIETTPSTTSTTEEALREIKPSKTVVLPVQPKEKVSIVQVLPETPRPLPTKPAGPLKFIPKAVPKVAIKPILKPKPKVVEVTPQKPSTTVGLQEPAEPQEPRYIVKPVPKAVIIKPVAPIVKVVATKVEPSTTTTTTEAAPLEEEESEEEVEEEVEEQEPVAQEEVQAEEAQESAEPEEEEEEVEQEEPIEEPKPEDPTVKVTDKQKPHVIEAVKPVTTTTTTTTTTTEEPAQEPVEEDDEEQVEEEEQSPIVLSTVSETQATQTVTVVRPEDEKKTSVVVTRQPEVTPQAAEDAEEGEADGEEVEEEEEEQEEPVPVLQIGNNIGEPEYDFLSRQPSEFVEETFRVVNLRPTATAAPADGGARTQGAKAAKPKRGNKRGGAAHPTGLVTKLGGTVVKEGVTTVHETSVIGTYISGKYAQVLQSTSHVIQGNSPAPVPAAGAVAAPAAEGRRVKLNPSSTLRILKTAAPSLNKTPRYSPEAAASIITPSPASQALDDTGLPLENLFASAPSSSPLVRPSRRLPGGGINSGGGNFKNRLKNRLGKDDNELQDGAAAGEEPTPAAATITPQPPAASGGGAYGKKPASRFRNTQVVKPAAKNTRFNRYSASSVEVATVVVASAPAGGPAYQNRRNKSSRNGFKPTSAHSVVSATAQYQQQQQQQQQYQQQQQEAAANRRSFKPKPQPSAPEQDGPGHSTSLYKFKLNRSPGRWQYKSPAKPTVAIRKQSAAKVPPPGKDQVLTTESLTTAPISDPSVQFNDIAQSGEQSEKVDPDADLDQSGSVHGNVLNDAETDNQIERRYPIETLKVEISTPADFRDTYYEIATIKSPYTFQVGTVKNTRYITVTSTIEKVLEQETATITPSLTEPLTENILATTTHIDKESNLLDSSIATLPPIVLGTDTETPPLETLTETFSTTQVMLKTHILPVIRDGADTSSYTLIQTYHVTRLVTATKTLPPMELYHFVPSRTLNEFNSRLDEAGSELHLELEFGDDNENDDGDEKPKRERLPSDLDLSSIGSDFDLSEVDKANLPENIRPKKKVSSGGNNRENRITTEAPVTTPALTPEQLQQLALLRLLNPAAAAQIPSVITSSKPVVKLETVYESHVLPIVNGQNTILSTISRPIGTITKTNYEIVTTTLPTLPLPPIPQLNPFLQPQQPPQLQQQQQQPLQLQSTPVVTQTIVTETNSKVLKLTFGAKTAYTTLYSTTVVPTVLTTYLTQSVSVQPTAAFPGYFPNPYAPFPFVG